MFSLDRELPVASLVLALARFRGQSKPLTRWLSRQVAPRLAAFARARWRMPQSAFFGSADPIVLCHSSGTPRDAVPLLIAEWLEFRRLSPASKLRFAVPVATSKFDAVAPIWQQVRALKKQLGVRCANVFLFAGDAEPFFDAASVVVSAATNDVTERASAAGKIVIAPHGDIEFTTRPAVIRFVGEPRTLETASVSWPMPEPLAVAKAFRRAAAEIEKSPNVEMIRSQRSAEFSIAAA